MVAPTRVGNRVSYLNGESYDKSKATFLLNALKEHSDELFWSQFHQCLAEIQPKISLNLLRSEMVSGKKFKNV